MLIPVEGNKGLFRDKNSSAILNCSDSDYQKYLEVKNTKMKEVSHMNEMSEKINEIDQLKSDVNEMKDMMKLILSKLDSNS
jgi:acyl-CoA hydrolase